MKHRHILVAMLLTVGLSCSSPEQMTEIQRFHTGSLDVVLLSQDGILHQTGQFVVEFRSSDGKLADVGSVNGKATMPMAGMAPMFGSIELKPLDERGRYTATGRMEMAGGWRIELEWRGPGGAGTVAFQRTVQ